MPCPWARTLSGRAPRYLRSAIRLALALGILTVGTGASAQSGDTLAFGETVVEVVVEQEGQILADPMIARLVGEAVGRPLSMSDVRRTVTRLDSLRRFEDIRPHAEPLDDGVRLRYVVVPFHPVDRVEFRGTLGLSERDLRRAVTERFGDAPDASRSSDVEDLLRTVYRTRGYPDAQVVARIEESHGPDRASMILQVQSGPRAIVSEVRFQQLDPDDATLVGLPDVRQGQPYDAPAIDRQLDEYVNRMRSRGYYEARATHTVLFDPENRSASVTVNVGRGPRVIIAFSGDPLPANERERLVPVRAEGSADEDLLEDAVRAIEEYLFAGGYANATAGYTRAETADLLTITFEVNRGLRHVVDAVRLEGNTAIPDGDLQDLLRTRRGEPFVRRTIDAGVSAIEAAYRTRGFGTAAVMARIEALPPERPGDQTRRVEVVIEVDEGPLTIVRSITFEGNTARSDAQLLALMTTAERFPYSALALLDDRDRLDLAYRNLGYEGVRVEVRPVLVEENTLADVQITIREGPQVFVDQIIIIGNERTSIATIERELLLEPGEPLGYSALIESRSRLIALGLFRRVQVEPLAPTNGARRDVLVQIEEAPPNTLGFGGGLEGGFRSRPTAPGGVSEERFELVPRGFFEIGRRNLWGKNRAVNLFTRVSLRSRDPGRADEGAAITPGADVGGYGFNEYRVFATFREPRIFGSRADILVTGILDRAIRSSFNFITREVRAESGARLSPRYSVLGRYSFRRTELFDERFDDDEKPIIDRLFPQIRLSKFAGSFIRDTRDDLFDPSRGTFVLVDADLAARAFGSEVGFIKTYLQAFSYRLLPTERRIVLALGSRVGVARGFPREVLEVGEDGEPVVTIVQDVHASERFFAGGDTTVRGFSLDRLGTSQTISPVTGFPTGGNSVIILNAELRVALFGRFRGVGFIDAGNVYQRASDINVTDLRPAAGVGVWYQSPVGPIRLDVGFNLDRREITPPKRERGYVLHLSLGPAF